jgi:hypothetical protein
MMRTLHPGYDRNVLTPPFGVVFRDHLDQQVIAGGLEVSLIDPRQPGGRAQQLHANPHGVFVAHRVRGLRSAVDGSSVPVSPAATRRFDLRVTDPLGRYVPLRLPVELPGDGLFQPSCLAHSPNDVLPHVPLYSAAARDVPAGHGEVRAELRLASDPAACVAWARLELWLDATLIAEGVADERGSALLICQLPALRDPPLRSSPAVAPGPRSQWNVSLRAFWDAGLAQETVPDLCRLQKLPEVTLLQSLSPSTPLGSLLLVAGSPLIARSAGSSFVFVGA